MAHKHIYTGWLDLAQLSVVINPDVGWCGYNHYNDNRCRVLSHEIGTLVHGEWGSKETSLVADVVGHTHTYSKVVPIGNVIGLNPYEIQYCPCSEDEEKHTAFLTYEGMATAFSIVNAQTSEAIYDEYGAHYHTILQPAYFDTLYPNTPGYPKSLKACPQGHSDCIVAEWAPYRLWLSSTVYEISVDWAYEAPLSPRATKPVEDKPTLEHIRNIEVVTGGRFYIDREGKATYKSRYARNA